ncbi:MAG TPA: hypothetical protein VL994_14375 [Steroidobacteraceae bacterium]|nr:hypothetical protein [Steroidobacteraceae bacterium]
MLPKFISEPLQGKTPLRRVFWLYGVGVSVAYTALGAFVPLDQLRPVLIYTLVGLALGVVQSVMLWKCAYNSPSRSHPLGRLLRVCVIAGLLATALVLYLVIAHPEALLPGKLISPDL